MEKSNYSGFFRLSVEERLKEVAEFANLTEDEQKTLDAYGKTFRKEEFT